MSEALSDDRYTDEERAYLESGGAPLSTLEEPKPQPKDEPAQPADQQEPQDPPEQDDDGSDADEPEAQAEGERKPRKVNYGAFVKQKKEAAEARRQYEELRQRYENDTRQFVDFRARAEERFRALQPQQQQPEAPKAPATPPDLENDPLAYIRWQNEQMAEMKARLDQTEQGFQQSAEQQRQSQLLAQLDHTYKSANRAAAEQEPAFVGAYNFLTERQRHVIRVQNPRYTPQQVEDALMMQERQLAAVAIQQGQNPAAMIWQMAHVYGYNHQAAQPQAPAQPDPAAEQARLDAARRGQEANRSLSGAGRPGSLETAMTVDRLVDMPHEEFLAWRDKNPGKYAQMQGVN